MTDDEVRAAMREAAARGDDAVAELLARIDEEEAADRARLAAPGALLNTALFYARLGIPVLPLHHPTAPHICSCQNRACGSVGKHPRTRRGLHDASCDEQRIRAWWQAVPEANIGLRTGVLFDVIDVDGVPGFHSLMTMLTEGVVPPVIGRQGTPRGGSHQLIAPTGAGCATALRPGIDYRGADGYVVAAPSRGANGHRYVWTMPFTTDATAHRPGSMTGAA